MERPASQAFEGGKGGGLGRRGVWQEGHISKGLMLGEWEGRGGLDWETSRR